MTHADAARSSDAIFRAAKRSSIPAMMARAVSCPYRPAPTSREELLVRAAALRERTVGELAAAMGTLVPQTTARAKGFVGQLVERALGADPCAGPRPDFPNLHVELKTVPVDARGMPLESTFCCSIHMLSADSEAWETSRLRRRLGCVLWLPVQGMRQMPLSARRFGAARLWQPGAAEEALLRADWEELIGAIGAGFGAWDSSRGEVLQLRPKAAHARVRTLAPGPDGPQAALPLGFYLRRSFTARLLSS